MFYNAKESTINIPNNTINYISFGSGKKKLLMIQGLNTNTIKGMAIPLALMYRIFAKEYTVYLFDRKTILDDDITVKEMANDIALALDILGIDEVDVLGVSEGGMIAQYLAINYPDLVNKLVLALTLSRNNPVTEAVIKHWITLCEAENYKALIIDMASKMYSAQYLKLYRPFLPLLTHIQKPKDPKRFITLCQSCLTCNTYNDLDKIKCPTFVIGAKEDLIVGSEASLEIANKLKCPLYMYENLGHAAYEEASNFNQLVYDFLIKN